MERADEEVAYSVCVAYISPNESLMELSHSPISQKKLMKIRRYSNN